MDTPNKEKVKRASSRVTYSHAKADARKDRRREEADIRQAKYDSLTLKEKLASCIPGGSKRQRARLEAQLFKKPTTPEPLMVGAVAIAPALVGDETKSKRTPKSKVTRAAKADRPSKS